MEHQVIFPALHAVRVELPPDLRHRFAQFIREEKWTPAEGVKILLAYGADALLFSARSPEETYNEWAAARAELAALRHRAYLADEAIRSLQMNITGLGASNAQFEESLPLQETRRERLRQALASLEAEVRTRGIVLEPQPEPGTVEAEVARLMDFWRTQRDRRG